MVTVKLSLKSLSSDQLRDRRQQLLESLPAFDRLLRGSLITRHVRCGKPNCRCASGQGHPSLYLSTLHEGKTRLDYVPAAWEPWVRERLDNYHLAQELMVELAEINLELLRRREKD
ncbi:MAG: DUF6788 family protein [Bacillota bacterium]